MIDQPCAGEAVDRFGFLVRGWLWAGESQARIVAVVAMAGDLVLGRSSVLLPRRDVQHALGLGRDTKVAFEICAQHPGLRRGERFRVHVCASLSDGSTTPPLRDVEVCCFGAHDIARVGADGAIEAAGAGDAVLPPDHLQVRQVGSVWGDNFFPAGRTILTQLIEAFRDAQMPLEQAGCVLDFGCGCGRVLQAFRGVPLRGELWGCDIDAEAIRWNQAHLADVGRFCAHGPLPPVPLESGSVDAIYAVSVFTHLPEELQYAWLAELRRLLRPGGVLIASLHGGPYWNQDECLHAEVTRHGFAYRTGPRTEGLPEFYMVAYHSEAYVRTRWGRFFDVLAVRERLIHGAHDAAILRRPLE